MGLKYKVGAMGPMYGYQWRFFNKPYNKKRGPQKTAKKSPKEPKNKEKLKILQILLRSPRPWAPPGDFLGQGSGV